MKHFFSFALLLALLFAGSTAFAQTNFVGLKDDLKTKEDYARYEPDVIAAAKWLEETDLDKEKDKRKDVNAFVLQWMAGSPTVTVTLTEAVSKLYGKNTDLLGVYIASYARHALENKGASALASNKAAVQSMITVYKKGIAIKKNKEMEKVAAMSEADLEAYIAKKFK